MSQWVRSSSLLFALLLALSPCVPSPTLFFSDTEKLTLPPPSLLACFCPPFPPIAHHSLYTLLSLCFTTASPFAFLRLNTHGAFPSVPSHHFYHVLHVLLPPCHWLSVDAVLQPPLKTGFAYKSIACRFPPLSIHCSLHHSPSLFSQHHSLGTHFFSFSVCHVAFPPPHTYIYECLCTSLTLIFVHLHHTLALDTNSGVTGRNSIFCTKSEWILF